jgi:conjugative transfer signal peptidase TraF
VAGNHTSLRMALAGLAGIVVATSVLGLTYNTTPSLPPGVYRIRPLVAQPVRGEVVGFCLDREAARLALTRGYVHPAGLQTALSRTRCRHGAGVLGKPVAGVPGDTIEAHPYGVRINGRLLRRSQIQKTDRAGRALPAAIGRRVLGAGEYWLQSEFAGNSYDSRIFGPVREELILDRRVFMAGYPAVLLVVLALAVVAHLGQETKGASPPDATADV